MPGARINTRYTPMGRKYAHYVLTHQLPGVPGYIDATPYIAHVRCLNELGLSCRSIARQSGISESAAGAIAAGEHQLIRKRVALALRQVTHTPTPAQERVLGIGAVRRLRALSVLGWPWKPLSEHTTVSRVRMAVIVQREPINIDWTVWKAIHDLYEQFSATPGPCESTRERAMARDWWAPLDWEDLDIDDPRVTPTPAPAIAEPTAQELRAARQAEVARLAELGWPGARIAEELGITDRTVWRDLREVKSARFTVLERSA
ncbi:helix-turn-helix domain-containing protein [Nocardia carnea]|uniref:helix-turn-helix domain-containing protein n=1 Tax=Nocardia carnea TaxID=37328 RepID=UPI0024585370|nr:helix-turn-helix domain-containing protein [Nocardia carnea]